MASPGDQELNLLREWREPASPRRIAAAVVGSLLAHVVMISAVILAPENALVANAPEAVYYRKIVLYVPRELTQREANKGDITRTLDVRSLARAPPLVPQKCRGSALPRVPARYPSAFSPGCR